MLTESWTCNSPGCGKRWSRTRSNGQADRTIELTAMCDDCVETMGLRAMETLDRRIARQRAVTAAIAAVVLCLSALVSPLWAQEPDSPARESVALLSFTASWCPPCQTMKPIVAALQRDGVRVIVVDVDNPPGRVSQLEWKVDRLPTFIAIEDHGATAKELGRYVGTFSKVELASLLAIAQSPGVPQSRAAADWKKWTPASGLTPPTLHAIGPIPFPSLRPHSHSTLYEDLRAHSRGWQTFGNYSTTAHENGHLINAAIRNRHVAPGRNDLAGFYLGRDCAFVIDEPGVRTAEVAAFVPKSLRTYRFDTYITKHPDRLALGQVFDEWLCYIHGANTKIEYIELDTSPDDLAAAPLEMAVYGTAALLAIEQLRPDYSQQAFLCELFDRMLRDSLEVVGRGMKDGHVRTGFDYLSRIARDPDAAAIRNKWLAVLGTWQHGGLAFAPAPPIGLAGSIEPLPDDPMPEPEWKGARP